MSSALTPSSLAPGLLLAMPQLHDPNFTRSVVLMVEHNEEGSFGLVVNQPSGVRAVDLLESLGMAWRGEPDALVWSGGPVSPSTGWVLHEPFAAVRASGKFGDGPTVEVGPGLALTTSPDALRVIAAAPPPRIRLLLGYSGWAPGQLAAEVASGSWLHADADPDLVFHGPPDELWDRAVRSLGIANPDELVAGHGIH